MRLPEEKRGEFKEPKGELFENSEQAFEYLESVDKEKIITVGDRVSATLIDGGFEPDMVIVDFTVERDPASKQTVETVRNYSIPEVRIENPPGVISSELWDTISDFRTPIKIIVEGEEDLAVLPATLSAPLGSVVVYGQPGRGLVIVKVSEEKKKEFEKYSRCMIKED